MAVPQALVRFRDAVSRCSTASDGSGWKLNRVVVTRDNALLGVWCKAVAVSDTVRKTIAAAVPPATQREKNDMLPSSERVWSGIVLEWTGQRYVSWDGGELMRGFAGLERVELRARLADLTSVLRALIEDFGVSDAVAADKKGGHWTQHSGGRVCLNVSARALRHPMCIPCRRNAHAGRPTHHIQL